MKTKLVLLIAATAMFTFSSCKKCVECTYGSSGGSDVYCKPENFSNKAWNLQLDELEDDGYNCEPL